MAEVDLDSVVNTKHNLDGDADLNESYLFPREKLRLRQKAIVIKSQVAFNPIGISLDRVYSPSVLDNDNLQLDAPRQDPVFEAVLNPNQHFKENYYNEEFIDTDNTTATFDNVNNRYSIDDGEIIISTIIQKEPGKNIREVTFFVNQNNGDGFDLYIDSGNNVWRSVDSFGKVYIGDNSNGEYDSELRYKIENNTGSSKYVDTSDIRFIYW
jgi:hypothetical protein